MAGAPADERQVTGVQADFPAVQGVPTEGFLAAKDLDPFEQGVDRETIVANHQAKLLNTMSARFVGLAWR